MNASSLYPNKIRNCSQCWLLMGIHRAKLPRFAIGENLRFAGNFGAWQHISIRYEGLAMISKSNVMELTLCPCCANQFYNSPEHSIRRLDPYQFDKENCTFCGIRSGWDYVITPRQQFRNNLPCFRENNTMNWRE